MSKNKEDLLHLLHDIKSPVTSVMGFSELLKNALAKTSLEKEKAWANSINTESLKIKELLEEITKKITP